MTSPLLKSTSPRARSAAASAAERRVSGKPVGGASGVAAPSSLADDEAAGAVVAEGAGPTDIPAEAGAVSVGFGAANGAPAVGAGDGAFSAAGAAGSDGAGVEVISGFPAASSVAGVPVLTASFPAGCMTKKIVILTDATAPMEAKPRRGLRQRRAGAPLGPGASGFTILAGVRRISEAIALKALCCEGEVKAFPGSLGVIIRA